MKPDVTIPDLPKIVGHATSMGEPAMAVRGRFRTGMLLLAREVAFVRLLDSSPEGNAPATGKTGRLRRLLGLAS
jgi:hypothetical protein